MGLLGAGVVGEGDSYLHVDDGGSLNSLSPHISALPQFECCGAANYTDWEKILAMTNKVPDSCCVNITHNCGINFVVKDIHTEVGRGLR